MRDIPMMGVRPWVAAVAVDLVVGLCVVLRVTVLSGLIVDNGRYPWDIVT
jgi:hypothetical protein